MLVVMMDSTFVVPMALRIEMMVVQKENLMAHPLL